jgi:Holliday junction DNA helicase RuvB
MSIRHAPLIEFFLAKKREKEKKKNNNLLEDISKIPDVQLVEIQSLDQFVGHKQAKAVLTIAISSALRYHTAMDHVILFGPPGLGKTQLARLIAKELDAVLCEVTPAVLNSVNALYHHITLAEKTVKRFVLFIDEAHRLSAHVRESLYQVLQDYKFLNRRIKPITCIAATTDLGMLPKPLLDRFPIKLQLSPYSPSELTQIIKIHYPSINDEVAEYIAKRSRGVPRIALQYTRLAKAAAAYDSSDEIKMVHAEYVMDISGIDDCGLDAEDRRILRFLAGCQSPVGLKTLCLSLDISETEIRNVREPYLLKLGFITITPRGRMISPDGLRYVANVSDIDD